MSEPRREIFPLNCHECGGPLELACELGEAPTTETVRFACPYCGNSREFQAPGRVLWVAMRQHGTEIETKH